MKVTSSSSAFGEKNGKAWIWKKSQMPKNVEVFARKDEEVADGDMCK